MSISTTYLLNVALHATTLSIFAALLMVAMRKAWHRSVTAIAGLLAVGFLPWLTALRPAPPAISSAPKIETQALALPTWTVAIMPAKVDHPAHAEPGVVTTKFVFPDPLTSIISIWAAGSGIGLAMLGIALLKVRVWRKSLQFADDAAWQALRDLAPEITARNHFLISESTASPCVTGYWQPKIVIPAFLLEKGSEVGLRWAVRHELAHYQAGDSRWIILFTFIRCTNWWNPLVHRLVTKWADAREQLCDLAATGVSETRADYGEFLISIARKITTPPPLTVAMGKPAHAVRLKRRIVSLLEASEIPGKLVGKRFIALSSAVFVACAVIVSSVRIDAEEPARHQPDVETKDVPPATAPDSIKPPEDSKTPAAPEEVSKQMKTIARLVMTKTKPVLKDGTILNASEILPHLKSISTTKGSTLITSPSVTNRFGESATIEIIRGVPGNAKQIAGRGPDASVPIVGIVFETYAELVGDQANLKFDATYHFIPGAYEPILDSNGKFPKGLDPDKIQTLKRIITGRLSAGQTLCADLGEQEPGKFLQLFIQVIPIDNTGKELQKFRSPVKSVSSPSVEIHGKLRLTGYQIDIPANSIRYSFSPYGLTMTDAGSAQRWRSIPGATIKAYAPLEIPFNEITRPWNIPNLKISAIASSDFKLTSLKNYERIDTAGEPLGEPTTFHDIENGQWMHIGVKTDDSKIAREVYFQIEAIP